MMMTMPNWKADFASVQRSEGPETDPSLSQSQALTQHN